uniref:Putative secreted protein n=1 Tax=Anopheles marajoara TaxID=58244 RepID=A0A2M4CDZ7_9DIPT
MLFLRDVFRMFLITSRLWSDGESQMLSSLVDLRRLNDVAPLVNPRAARFSQRCAPISEMYEVLRGVSCSFEVGTV